MTPAHHWYWNVSFGLGWVRRRQHSLAQAVLALFCAAWLQAAVVPCVMAHASEPAQHSAPAAHQHHESRASHDHGAKAAAQSTDGASHPCLYCPPGSSDADSCDGHGGCAFMHDPQVDARAAGVIFTALPTSFIVSLPATLVVADCASASIPDDIPRISLSVSYCRFLE